MERVGIDLHGDLPLETDDKLSTVRIDHNKGDYNERNNREASYQRAGYSTIFPIGPMLHPPMIARTQFVTMKPIRTWALIRPDEEYRVYHPYGYIYENTRDKMKRLEGRHRVGNRGAFDNWTTTMSGVCLPIQFLVNNKKKT